MEVQKEVALKDGKQVRAFMMGIAVHFAFSQLCIDRGREGTCRSRAKYSQVSKRVIPNIIYMKLDIPILIATTPIVSSDLSVMVHLSDMQHKRKTA